MRIFSKHSLAVRIFHWLNFILLGIMIWSGLLIYWANDIYRFSFFGHELFHFFPEWFYNLLNIPFRLAEGMAWHFNFMWLFTLNGLIYVIWILISGEWKEIFPNKNSFRDAIFVVLHDLRIRKTKPAQKKYNAAQRLAYTGVIMMAILTILSGIAIYKPIQVQWLANSFGGYAWARWWHFTFTMLFFVFFVIHVVQVIFAGWNNFRAMVAGFEVIKDKSEKNKPK